MHLQNFLIKFIFVTIQFAPKTGGLGLKRKTGHQITKNDPKIKKPKTLAEKRDQLQDDIMIYGVAAIEKMYPRYPSRCGGVFELINTFEKRSF